MAIYYHQAPLYVAIIREQEAKLAAQSRAIDLAEIAFEKINKRGYFKPKKKKYACWGCDMGGGRPEEFNNTHDPDCPFLIAHETLAEIRNLRGGK